MRIGCLQFAPQVADTNNNLNRADSVLSKANPEDLDLLVLPELAFSGYNFKSLHQIAPFLEPSGSGITSLWARTVALKYNCVVTVGYPEKADVSAKWPTSPEYYNSAIVVNEDGETIANYRKSFLYYTDETWALEGDEGFYGGFIPGLGKTSIGICMDLNPYKFEAAWDAFEFGFHILEMESNLVIVSMAWMTREDRRQFSRMPDDPDMDTLTYWVARLEPLIRSNTRDEIIVVFCNRTGTEDEVTYAGTSAVVGVRAGEVKVYGLLGRGQKELLVVDTKKPPYAKLLYRPTNRGVAMSTQLHSPDQSSIDLPSPTTRQGGRESHGNDAQTPKDYKSDQFQQKAPYTKTLGDDGQFGWDPIASSAVDSSKSDQQPDRTGRTPKRRPDAPIKLPNSTELPRKRGSAESPGSESFNVLTPSAPSPTPMAIRPRLIIPESPPIHPYQYADDTPMSASSLISEHSVQSYKSDESEASVQTVRSNPRPPEESTPYPQSGAPLSGYPDNSWHADDLRIHNRQITSSQQHDGSNPTMSFHDISPTPYSWHPSDNFLRTQSSFTTGLGQGTPVGRRSEPFPWEAIKAESQQTPKIESNWKKTKNYAAVGSTSSGHSNELSSRTRARSGSTMGCSSSIQDRPTRTSQDEQRVGRPASSKSRNDSRSRMKKRSNSSLGESGVAAAVSMHLEGISQRAESVNSMRKGSIPDPLKSRSCSRNRNQDGGDPWAHLQMDSQRVPVSASPGVFRAQASTPEARGFYRSPSASGLQQRSNSFTSMNNHFNQARATGPAVGSNVAQHASRTASRGRQPGPQAHSSSPPERTSSRDSSRNDRLHSRVSRSRHESSGRSSGHASRNGRRSSNRNLSEYRRVESVVHPNCPVHGRRSTSVSDDARNVLPEHSRRDAAYLRGNSRPQSAQAEVQHEPEPGLRPELELGVDGPRSSSEYSSPAGALQIVLSSGRSHSNFDPATPKAMTFSVDDIYSEPADTRTTRVA